MKGVVASVSGRSCLLRPTEQNPKTGVIEGREVKYGLPDGLMVEEGVECNYEVVNGEKGPEAANVQFIVRVPVLKEEPEPVEVVGEEVVETLTGSQTEEEGVAVFHGLRSVNAPKPAAPVAQLKQVARGDKGRRRKGG